MVRLRSLVLIAGFGALSIFALIVVSNALLRLGLHEGNSTLMQLGFMRDSGALPNSVFIFAVARSNALGFSRRLTR